MKRRLGYYGISAGVVLGILTLVMTPAAAQEGQEGKPSEPGAAKSKPQSVPKGGAALACGWSSRSLWSLDSRALLVVFFIQPCPQKAIDPKATPEEPPLSSLGGRKDQSDDHNRF